MKSLRSSLSLAKAIALIARSFRAGVLRPAPSRTRIRRSQFGSRCRIRDASLAVDFGEQVFSNRRQQGLIIGGAARQDDDDEFATSGELDVSGVLADFA